MKKIAINRLTYALLYVAFLLAGFSAVHASERDGIVVEALLRLPNGSELVTNDRDIGKSVDRYLQSQHGTRDYLKVVDRLNVRDQAEGLASFLSAETDTSLRVEAIRLLLRFQKKDAIVNALQRNDETSTLVAEGLGLVGTVASESLLKPLLTENVRASVRIAATTALGRSKRGRDALVDLHHAGKLPPDCRYAAYDVLNGSPDSTTKEVALALKPAATKSGESLPSVSKSDQDARRWKGGKDHLSRQGHLCEVS